MIRRPPRSTLDRSSAASDVYKRQVHHLQPHVGIESRVKENDRIQTHVRNRGWPAPDILSDAEINADDAEQGGNGLDGIHGRVRLGSARQSFNVLHVVALTLALNACFLRKPPPQPVNTPE